MTTAVMIVGYISVDGGPPRPAVMTGSAQSLGMWGGVPPAYVDIGGPPQQPGIWPSPGHPAHPIAGPPPSVTHPIPPVVGGGPVFPPENPPPAWWPGSPSHPIPPSVWPQPPTGEQPPPPANAWSWGYSEEFGWVLVPPGGGGKPQPVP